MITSALSDQKQWEIATRHDSLSSQGVCDNCPNCVEEHVKLTKMSLLNFTRDIIGTIKMRHPSEILENPNKSNTIQAEWDECTKIFDLEPNTVQFNEMCKAFYAGANAFLELTLKLGTSGVNSIAANAILLGWVQEIETFSVPTN